MLSEVKPQGRGSLRNKVAVVAWREVFEIIALRECRYLLNCLRSERMKWSV